MAGTQAERQENGFIKHVKGAIRQNYGNPITLVVGDTRITNVTGAQKYKGRQVTGSEPYTDVQLLIGKKKATINLSMKGTSAPSLGGGGLRGIELVTPGLGKRYFEAVFRYLTKEEKLEPGDKVPDIYGKIPTSVIKKLIVGNSKMGGPIDYMYVGEMGVRGKYDKKKNVLSISGAKMTKAEKYAGQHKFYFRLRARRHDQRFDPDAKGKQGEPRIYSRSPSKGDSVGRLVVVNESAVPNNAKKIMFR